MPKENLKKHAKQLLTDYSGMNVNADVSNFLAAFTQSQTELMATSKSAIPVILSDPQSQSDFPR